VQSPIDIFPPQFDCVGDCPPGMICREFTVTTDDGPTVTGCDCVDEPQVCEPNAEGTACNSVVCEDPNQKCQPTKVSCTPNGCRIVECACSDCHVILTPGAAPSCTDNCPDGQECVPHRTVVGAGFEFECRCEPEEPVCEPDGDRCRPVVCPNADEKCVPIAVSVSPDGTYTVEVCDCRRSDECQAVLSDATVFPPEFDCVGDCPPGRICREFTITRDNGTTLTRCDCVEAPPVCEPNGGRLSGWLYLPANRHRCARWWRCLPVRLCAYSTPM
jgi:hypothetical protein